MSNNICDYYFGQSDEDSQDTGVWK